MFMTQAANQLRWTLTFFIFLIGIKPLFAAPMPMTSSSAFFHTEKEIFYSPLGFTVHAGKSNWVQAEMPRNNPYVEVVYRPQKDSLVQAALTVRTDKAGNAKNLNQYVQKWIKDYPRFGFEVIASKKVRVGEKIAHMFDLINKDNNKQLRQVLFYRDKHVVSFTCRDESAQFMQTLKACNEIIKTYK